MKEVRRKNQAYFFSIFQVLPWATSLKIVAFSGKVLYF